MRGYPKVLWQKRVTNYKRLKKRFKRIVKMFEQLDYNRVRSLDNEKLLQWMKWLQKLKMDRRFFCWKTCKHDIATIDLAWLLIVLET